MSSSLGYSCSRVSYLRELGRSRFIATWWAWPTSGRNFLGVSRLIIRPSTPPSIEADRSEVAVPPLDRVLLDEAVAAEQLHAVVADLHAALGAQPAGQRDLAGEALALRGAGGGAVGHQPHAVQLDADVGDHERHALPVADRLAERLPLVDVGDHVVEHRLGGAQRQRAPGQPGQPHALGVVLGAAQRRQVADPDVASSTSRDSEAAAQPHRRLGLDLEARGCRTRPGTAAARRRARRRPRTARRRRRAAPSTSRR